MRPGRLWAWIGRGRLAGGWLVLLGLIAAGPVAAEPRVPVPVETIRDGVYTPIDVSTDGRVVIGTAGSRWQSNTYMRWVDGLIADRFTKTRVDAMTPDGSVVVGELRDQYIREGFRWESGIFERLGFLFIPPAGGYGSYAHDVTPDGRTIVGWNAGSGIGFPVRWVDGVIEELPRPGLANNVSAAAISDDGSRIVGLSLFGSKFRMVVWEDGAVSEHGPTIDGKTRWVPKAMSPDGVVVGEGDFAEGRRAFAWDGAGFESLGTLSSFDEISFASDVAEAGDLVVGQTGLLPGGNCPYGCSARVVPMVWMPETGMRSFKDFMRYACGYDLDRWTTRIPVLDDGGNFVAFEGIDPTGFRALYVAEIGDSCDRNFETPANPLERGDFIATSATSGGLIWIDRETGDQDWVSPGEVLYNARQLAQGPEGEIYARDGYRVARIDPVTGAQQWLVTLDSTAASLAVDIQGRVFAVEKPDSPAWAKPRLVELDRETGEKTVALEGPYFGGNGGGRLLAGRNGLLYYRGAVGADAAIIEIDPDTGDQTPVIIGDLPNTTNMTIGRDNRLMWPLFDHVVRIDPETGLREEIPLDADRTSINRLYGFGSSVDSDGRIITADGDLYQIMSADLETGELFRISAHDMLQTPQHVIPWLADCDDGFDNDGDGLFDYPDDPGCSSPIDETEIHFGIEIDIVPGSKHNVLPPRRRGLVSVAVLGSADFDVRSLDAETVRFGPGEATPAFRGRGSRQDVNRDGFRDWTFKFRVRDAAIPPDAIEACLSGETDGAVPVFGCDVVAQRPLCGVGFELAFVIPPLVWLRRRRRSPAAGPRWDERSG